MLAELIAKLKDWMLVTDGGDRLRNLDDRLLADLGVERAKIDEFVRGKTLVPAEAPAEVSPVITVGSPHPRIPRRHPAETRRIADAFAPRSDRRSGAGQ